MATAGSRHVMKSYGEVNDGPAVIPGGSDGAGFYTHVLVDHPRPGSGTYAKTDVREVSDARCSECF